MRKLKYSPIHNALASILLSHLFTVFNRLIKQIPYESEDHIVLNVFAKGCDILSNSFSRDTKFTLNAEAEKENV